MLIKVNINNLQRELARRGLRPMNIDQKANMSAAWAAGVIFRLQKKAELRPATLHKLAKAIGCSVEAIAIFDDDDKVRPLPSPSAPAKTTDRKGGKAKTNGKAQAA